MYASRKDGVRRRLEFEGALAAACRAAVEDTRMAAGGKELGTWAGTSKADVDAEGVALIKGANENGNTTRPQLRRSSGSLSNAAGPAGDPA